jgi:hypothetical protein
MAGNTVDITLRAQDGASNTFRVLRVGASNGIPIAPYGVSGAVDAWQRHGPAPSPAARDNPAQSPLIRHRIIEDSPLLGFALFG